MTRFLTHQEITDSFLANLIEGELPPKPRLLERVKQQIKKYRYPKDYLIPQEVETESVLTNLRRRELDTKNSFFEELLAYSKRKIAETENTDLHITAIRRDIDSISLGIVSTGTIKVGDPTIDTVTLYEHSLDFSDRIHYAPNTIKTLSIPEVLPALINIANFDYAGNEMLHYLRTVIQTQNAHTLLSGIASGEKVNDISGILDSANGLPNTNTIIAFRSPYAYTPQSDSSSSLDTTE